MQNNAKIGGILSIVSGAFGAFHLVMAILGSYMIRYMFSGPQFSYRSPTPPPEFLNIMSAFYVAWGVFFMLVGIFAIVSGVFALKRRHWGLALAGAIAGTVTFFPCGIPAIIYVSMAKAEFTVSDHPSQGAT